MCAIGVCLLLCSSIVFVSVLRLSVVNMCCNVVRIVCVVFCVRYALRVWLCVCVF